MQLTFQAVPAIIQILLIAVLKQICVAICMVTVIVMMSALWDSPVEIVMKAPISLWEQIVAQFPRVKTVLPPRNTLDKDIVMKTGSVLVISYVVIIPIVMKALIILLGQIVENKVTLTLLLYICTLLES